MSEEKTELTTEEICEESESFDGTVQEKDTEFETPSDAQAEFSENYRKLPVWKQVVLLVPSVGGMTAVTMVITFVVQLGS